MGSDWLMGCRQGTYRRQFQNGASASKNWKVVM
jgi:hypothetical protein